MNKLFLLLICLLTLSFVSAFSVNIPSYASSGNYSYVSVNTSDFWDALDTPADIFLDDLGSLQFSNNFNGSGNFTTSGRIGIGTDAPAYKLEIKDTNTNLLRLQRINIGIFDFDIIGAWPGVLELSSASFSHMAWDRSNGFVGIGTNAPSRDMELRKATSPIFRIRGSDTGAGGVLELIGNAGVPTIRFGTTADPDAGRITYNTVTNNMDFITNNLVVVTIDSSGLDVNGSILTKNITVQDSIKLTNTTTTWRNYVDANGTLVWEVS